MKLVQNPSEKLICEVIGKKHGRNSTSLGSPHLFLKTSIPCHNTIDARANFELYENGLLIHMSKSSRNLKALIPFSEILRVQLTGGNEIIAPQFPSRFWILLKLGLPVRYARNFFIRPSEYSIDECSLTICLNNMEVSQLDFICSGYLYERQLKFFRKVKEITTTIIDIS